MTHEKIPVGKIEIVCDGCKQKKYFRRWLLPDAQKDEKICFVCACGTTTPVAWEKLKPSK